MDCVFLGEAWGKDEDIYKHPFVGAAGQELYRMLGQAGWECSPLSYKFVSCGSMMDRWKRFPHPLLNVFNSRPPDPENKNNVDYFYGARNEPTDHTLWRRRFGSSQRYVLEPYADDVHKLHKQLRSLKPNLIVALGNTPMWALGLGTGIGKRRGSVVQSEYGKVLPVTHPAAILRNWEGRSIAVLDFHKARRECKFPEIRTTNRYIWTEPSIPDLWAWWKQHGSKSDLIAFDIETLKKRMISEIGFAASPTQALHIPFVLEQGSGNCKRYVSYWSEEDEVEAWKFVKMVCESAKNKIVQNGVQYDTYWMLVELGIALRNIKEDTMTKAHAWQPELQKNLGFLGSIFLDERSWKGIRTDVSKAND